MKYKQHHILSLGWPVLSRLPTCIIIIIPVFDRGARGAEDLKSLIKAPKNIYKVFDKQRRNKVFEKERSLVVFVPCLEQLPF